MPKQDDNPRFEKVCDKADLVRLRDTDQLSWAKVAQALGLGSPGAARRIYSAVVRPHTESVLVRTSRSSDVEPVTLDTSKPELIKQALEGRTLIVERKGGLEDIYCVRVTSVKGDTVNFNDGTKARSVKAAAIIGIKP